MTTHHDPLLRFGVSRRDSTHAAGIRNTPPLPAVDYAAVGQSAPALPATPAGTLPRADAVVITWAEAEWAAMQQVFCGGGAAMPYADRTRSRWAGWEVYNKDRPSGVPSSWMEWGSYRLVEIANRPVLLFKSNTHLDYPGASTLEALVRLLIAEVAPTLILSIGTAGGARTTDHIGTVRAVSAGTLYEAGKPAADWPEYRNGWTASTALPGADLSRLLFAIPTTTADLQTLADGFNRQHTTSYTLAQLDPAGLNLGDAVPQVVDETGGATSLLTTSTFVVGTTAGDFEAYNAIEMDDAVIGKACAGSNVAFGFIRNVSDPVQNAALPASVQGSWGSVVYEAYGLYTSYNGAVAAWAALAGALGASG